MRGTPAARTRRLHAGRASAAQPCPHHGKRHRPRRAFPAALLLPLALASCIGLGPAPLPDAHFSVAVPPEVVATACARIVREAFPGADDRPWHPGAVVHARGGGHYTIEVALDRYGALRVGGNVRLRLAVGPDGLEPAVRSTSQLATRAEGSAGAIAVEVRRDGPRTSVRVRQTGALAGGSVADRISATLALVDTTLRGRSLLRSGAHEHALQLVQDALLEAHLAVRTPDPPWLAFARSLEASCHLHGGDRAAGQAALATAVALWPDFEAARQRLAQLSRELALQRAADDQHRVLAAAPGLGFVALTARLRLPQDSARRRGDAEAWLAAAERRFRAGDLGGARRFAQRARSLGEGHAAEALGLLSTVAEAGGDARLAAELRLCQAQRVGLTTDIAVALGRILDRQGEPERALLWVARAESDGAPDAAPADALRGLVSRVGRAAAMRSLSSYLGRRPQDHEITAAAQHGAWWREGGETQLPPRVDPAWLHVTTLPEHASLELPAAPTVPATAPAAMPPR